MINPAWDIDSGPHFRAIILLPEAASICVRDLVPFESVHTRSPWGHMGHSRESHGVFMHGRGSCMHGSRHVICPRRPSPSSVCYSPPTAKRLSQDLHLMPPLAHPPKASNALALPQSISRPLQAHATGHVPGIKAAGGAGPRRPPHKRRDHSVREHLRLLHADGGRDGAGGRRGRWVGRGGGEGGRNGRDGQGCGGEAPVSL